MLIKLQCAYESPGILVKDFDLADLGWVLRFCITKNFPGYVADAGVHIIICWEKQNTLSLVSNKL